MKLLVVFLLIGTMMALTRAFPEPEPEPEAFPEAEPEDSDDESTDEAMPEPAETGNGTDEGTNLAVLKRSARSSCTYRDNYWYRYGDSYYVYVKRAANWVTAQRLCVSYGGSLVSLRNSREEAFVKLLAKNRYAWIGLSDAQQAGVWLWMGGARYSYSNWCRREPSNGSSEMCTVMNVSSARCWYDITCTPSFYFVCSRRVR
ncbi:galactose-specific lectin nattectin-like [Sphaeramia orbicularis]|uniref:Galactose-specific lectin nattectin-like n=1 Tax=Sphaeramia orbicularis TaxID=375764 RepID=A0A673BSM8_9TELE|nr:galactose-specific lectin nattectin-like [Sphaeramia orbicularis]